MNNDLMFSSLTDQWDSPADLVADLGTVFPWDVDVCASRPNVCERYFDAVDNGLRQPWYGLCWMNPPYGRGIGRWMSKANNESGNVSDDRQATAVVSLIPARTNTNAWHGYVPWASQVVFIKGRLAYGSDEAWIDLHQQNIMKPKATMKQLNALVRKIGGVHCQEPVLVKLAGMFRAIHQHKKLPWTFAEWMALDHLKKESAPFPSAFVVWGQINPEQRRKLNSYGWSPVRG